MGNGTRRVLCGDSRELLAQVPDEHYSFVVTDNPYGLTSIVNRFGKEGAAPAQFGTDGAFARLGKGFMGTTWDGSQIELDVSFWRLVWMKCKPGAYLCAFGSTRTFHRIMCAIEDAGWELRDNIQVVGWTYSTGFPKSHSVSKKIDEMMGAERTEGRREWRGGLRSGDSLGGGSGQDGNGTTTLVKFDTPASEEAAMFDGYGSALKPSWGPVMVFRKPLSESSIAANCLKHGTGSINIDSTRVGGPGGRWTPNTVLLHNSGCVRIGTIPSDTESRSSVTPNRHDGTRLQNSDEKNQFDYAGEPVDEWRCEPNCAVRRLAEQGGSSVSAATRGNGTRNASGSDHTVGGWSRPEEWDGMGGYGDKGTIARFFPQFQADDSDWPMIYVAKPSKTEKNQGLSGAPDTVLHRTNPGGLENDPKWGHVVTKNGHATVKPVTLMRHLIRLTRPPVIDPENPPVGLDCFLGSGTTLVAAAYEGVSMDGMEMSDEYCEIARARVAYAESRADNNDVPPIRKPAKKAKAQVKAQPSVVPRKPSISLESFNDDPTGGKIYPSCFD